MKEDADNMIAKKDLQHGAYYHGVCRNSYIAVWDGKRQKFMYMRSKWNGWLLESIRHPEDDDGFDLFIPLQIIDFKPAASGKFTCPLI